MLHESISNECGIGSGESHEQEGNPSKTHTMGRSQQASSPHGHAGPDGSRTRHELQNSASSTVYGPPLPTIVFRMARHCGPIFVVGFTLADHLFP